MRYFEHERFGMKRILYAATLVGAGAFGAIGIAMAQVAGSSTTKGTGVDGSTQAALGWSAKRTILGKTVYNEAGEKVGKVEDLIIAPDKNVSYLIIGAGGFVGIGRYDVAIPMSQVQNQAGGRLVMPGATKEIVKSMPRFGYADDAVKRDEFLAKAEPDIAKAREELNALQKKAALASADTKAALELQIRGVQLDLKSAETKLAEMKSSAASRWKALEPGVTAANARLRKSLDKATG